MSTAVIVLNVVFSVSVITCIVGLLLWGIATQRRDHPAPEAELGPPCAVSVASIVFRPIRPLQRAH